MTDQPPPFTSQLFIPNNKLDDSGRGRNSAGLGEWNAALDVEPPPPRGWLLGSSLCRQFISSLLADGGTGKTALRFLQALALSTGRPLTGEPVFQRCRVLIVSLEDDADELRRRILAARLHYNIPLSELDGWLFLAASGAKAGKLKVMNGRGQIVDGHLKTNLEVVIKARCGNLAMRHISVCQCHGGRMLVARLRFQERAYRRRFTFS